MRVNSHFGSVHLTLLRAQYHIADLNDKINEFIYSKPWSYHVESDLKAGEYLHKIKFQRQLPANLPCILFDAANNLRAALDQAGYASAIASGRKTPKRTNFPFADDLAGLNNNIDGRGVCNDLPPEIRALFRGFCPYKGGNDTLWTLNKLCNTKKHCTLIPFNIGSVQLSDATGRNVIFSIMGRQNPAWDADKYEITLDRVAMDESPEYQAQVALNVAIDGIETLQRKPTIGALREMMNAVESVVGATKSECVRLGFG